LVGNGKFGNSGDAIVTAQKASAKSGANHLRNLLLQIPQGGKMKTNLKALFAILVLVIALAALASPAVAKTTKTAFTGRETILGPIDPGVTKCNGGMCLTTGAVWKGIEDTTDPRASGDMTIVVNSTYPFHNAVSPMWGTFRIVNGIGEWNGTWNGSHRLVGVNDIVDIRGVAHGSGGLTGLISNWHWTGLNVSWENPYHEISGTILETGQ
jgi:hypothetical protein